MLGLFNLGMSTSLGEEKLWIQIYIQSIYKQNIEFLNPEFFFSQIGCLIKA